MATDMLEKMKSLVQEHDTCVLATAFEGRPHCSLMAYAVDDACGEIYMVTLRDTKKYNNLVNNPYVSLLIDTRGEHAGQRRAESKALTVEGKFRPIPDTEKRFAAEARLSAVHPYLKDFISNQDAEIFSVKIVSFLLLEGVSEAYYEKA